MNKTQQKRWHAWAVMMAVFTGCLWLTGCGKAPQMEFDSAEEAIEALNSAENIEIYADLYSKKKKTEIVADGKVAGYLQGDTVYIDGEEWFSIDYVTDEPINEDGSTTYGYYDADGNCRGYAQERYLDLEDGSREPFLVFLDTDGTMLDYFGSKGAWELYDGDGNRIGTGRISRDGVSLLEINYTNIYRTVFKIDRTEAAYIDFMDLMAMNEVLQSNERFIDDNPVNTGVQIYETVAFIAILIMAIGGTQWKKKRKE